mmetsp:Transcript_31018/g.81213  ORF Transcript_31018/g.81213 Transcript_31018/m.81213 type:complete len:215 (-) Transcript_31018:1164-1808(-)
MFQAASPPPDRVLYRRGGVPPDVVTALTQGGVRMREWPPDASAKALDVDFVVGKAAAVTLLTEGDVIALDKELVRSRLHNVKKYSRPVVLVWKSVASSEGYIRAQLLASTEFRVPVVPVGSPAEAAAFVKTLHEQESHNTKANTLKALPSSRNYDQQVLTAVMQVPGLGEKTALRLLSRFPSLQYIANASLDSLVGWIGDGSGRSVYAFFHDNI